ncbi:MAG: phage holin family protein [Ignavibacteria bacterium]|nr:phage holin family protein [Ignavibacteria bacterium]
MTDLIIKWIVNAAVLLIGVKLLHGAEIKGFGAAMFVAVIIGVLNVLLKPILTFFSFPIILLSLGLFTLVINAIVILLASGISEDFRIGSFWNALVLGVY